MFFKSKICCRICVSFNLDSMTLLESQKIPLGTPAPDFALEATDSRFYVLEDFKEAKILVVVFMCNHCPFVKHILKVLVKLAKEYQARSVAVVGINSNDVESFPEDSPENMSRVAKEAGFSFPYLYDASQEVARSYGAACTPDFFLFDKEMKLVYRGQMDDSRPGNDISVTGADLTSVIDAVLANRKVSRVQKPSMGCNIKWKKGKGG